MCSKTLVALILPALFGCSTTLVAEKTLLDPPPANLLVLCPAPEQIDEATPLLMGAMAQADVDLATQYHVCALRQHALVRWVNGAVEKLKR